jgi:catechol 2,3-dioxygenase-like lactoylglutathione lyase family enzyme
VTLQIKAIIETAIYVDDLQAADTFYRTVLGLKVIAQEPGRHVLFRVGEAKSPLRDLAVACSL